jgi:L-histidine N-alpha-methyltransferase
VQTSPYDILFKKDEVIDMETSQKYTLEDIMTLADAAGFTPVADFYDKKNWFLDTLWMAF